MNLDQNFGKKSPPKIGNEPRLSEILDTVPQQTTSFVERLQQKFKIKVNKFVSNRPKEQDLGENAILQLQSPKMSK